MTRKPKQWLGTDDRYIRLRQIESLDLATRYRDITQLFYQDFQSTMVSKSLNGFLMNIASPRISAVLASTGELEHRIAKRVIDTIALSSKVMQHGFTGEGRDAARRVNDMHRRYNIDPEDFLAVGSEEVVGSIELAERYGWRPVSDKEREALNFYYSHQARAFGSPNPLPATYAETKILYEAYVETHIRYASQNARTARVVVNWLATLAPALVRPLFRTILVAQLDDRIAHACGIRPASAPVKALAHAALQRMARKDPIPDGAPSHLEALVRQVYPHGYAISDLGTCGNRSPNE